MTTRKRMRCNEEQVPKDVTLGEEKALVNALLFALEQDDVNALVILENEERMCVMSNGISGKALKNFIIHTFLEHPELFKASMGTLHSLIEMARASADIQATIH